VAYTAYYDDMAVSLTGADYPLPDLRVKGLSPDGMTTGFGNPGGALVNSDGTAISSTTYTFVDDVPMSIFDGTAVKQTSTSTTNYVGLTFADAAESCIRAVRAYGGFSTQGVNPADNGTSYVYDGTTNAGTIYSGGMTNSATALATPATMVTPTSASWTQTAVNGLTVRFGYSNDANPAPL